MSRNGKTRRKTNPAPAGALNQLSLGGPPIGHGSQPGIVTKSPREMGLMGIAQQVRNLGDRQVGFLEQIRSDDEALSRHQFAEADIVLLEKSLQPSRMQIANPRNELEANPTIAQMRSYQALQNEYEIGR